MFFVVYKKKMGCSLPNQLIESGCKVMLFVCVVFFEQDKDAFICYMMEIVSENVAVQRQKSSCVLIYALIKRHWFQLETNVEMYAFMSTQKDIYNIV